MTDQTPPRPSARRVATVVLALVALYVIIFIDTGFVRDGWAQLGLAAAVVALTLASLSL